MPVKGQTPVYTDGTEVKPGDSIRYRQAAGGLLPRSENWKTGIAVPAADLTAEWMGNLHMQGRDDRTYYLLGHEIERDINSGKPEPKEIPS